MEPLEVGRGSWDRKLQEGVRGIVVCPESWWGSAVEGEGWVGTEVSPLEGQE